MINQKLLSGTASAILFMASPTIAATVLTGDARLTPAGEFGGQLRTGEVAGGTALINDGEDIALTRGTSTGDQGEDAPGVIVGRRAGTQNEITIDNATVTIDAQGSSGFVQIAREGVDAQLILQNGATLVIKDDLAGVAEVSDHVIGGRIRVRFVEGASHDEDG